MIKNILVVIGTRPNFIKVTCFKKIASIYPHINLKMVHTGQHYDTGMADVFFKQFDLTPDFYLNIKADSPNSQIAGIMTGLEELVKKQFIPDLMIVVGDVNSTLAAALTANKLNIKLAHVESGLRSFDRVMPEEMNRILTDKMADMHFVTEPSGIENLKNENVGAERVKFVGNTMIDSMIAFSHKIEDNDILQKLNLSNGKYVLATIHRPSNVDVKEGLLKTISLLSGITRKYKVVFPIHPRTIHSFKKFDLYEKLTQVKDIVITPPLDYFAFQKLIKYSKFIITDSGGIQEESTFLKIPCLTLRKNTERPVTCTIGTNTLVNFELDEINRLMEQIEKGTYKQGKIPELWDGHATERIFKELSNR